MWILNGSNNGNFLRDREIEIEMPSESAKKNKMMIGANVEFLFYFSASIFDALSAFDREKKIEEKKLLTGVARSMYT